MDNLNKLISDNDFVDFANYGDGVSLNWIEKAQKRLGFTFPESYKWWLLNYGGGEIYGQEIYSIYERDFDDISGGDIVSVYENNIKNKTLSKDKVAVCEPADGDEVYYFKLMKDMKLGDAVYLDDVYSQFEVKYADNFFEFLEKQITAWL